MTGFITILTTTASEAEAEAIAVSSCFRVIPVSRSEHRDPPTRVAVGAAPLDPGSPLRSARDDTRDGARPLIRQPSAEEGQVAQARMLVPGRSVDGIHMR